MNPLVLSLVLLAGLCHADGDPAPLSTSSKGDPAPLSTSYKGDPAPLSTSSKGDPAPLSTSSKGDPALSTVLQTQLDGIAELVSGMKQGVFATCNLVLFKEMVNYTIADRSCKNFDIGTGEQGGHLATVNNAQRNDELMLLLRMAHKNLGKSAWSKERWVWAGLRKTKNNQGAGSKEMIYDSTDWQWATGEHPGDFEKWMPGQPDQRNMKYRKKGPCNEKPVCYQNQMRINVEGVWDDTFKYKEHSYVCDYQGKYLISNKRRSWEDAKAACVRAGLHLAMIRTDEELGEMLQAMGRFLGPRRDKKWDDTNWLWLGGNDVRREGEWTWVDGEEIKWQIPWESKAGNDNSVKKMKEGQDVMALSKWGTVDDSYREGKYRPFACQCPGT